MRSALHEGSDRFLQVDADIDELIKDVVMNLILPISATIGSTRWTVGQDMRQMPVILNPNDFDAESRR